MPSTLIRGKYVLSKVTDRDIVETITDGAVFQQDGEIIDVGRYDKLKARYAADEEIGSDQYRVLPGLVNSHQHGRGVSNVLKGIQDDLSFSAERPNSHNGYDHAEIYNKIDANPSYRGLFPYNELKLIEF